MYARISIPLLLLEAADVVNDIPALGRIQVLGQARHWAATLCDDHEYGLIRQALLGFTCQIGWLR